MSEKLDFFSTIEINLANGVTATTVKVDGKLVKGLVGFDVRCRVDEFTQVTLIMDANVELTGSLQPGAADVRQSLVGDEK